MGTCDLVFLPCFSQYYSLRLSLYTNFLTQSNDIILISDYHFNIHSTKVIYQNKKNLWMFDRIYLISKFIIVKTRWIVMTMKGDNNLIVFSGSWNCCY